MVPTVTFLDDGGSATSPTPAPGHDSETWAPPPPTGVPPLRLADTVHRPPVAPPPPNPTNLPPNMTPAMAEAVARLAAQQPGQRPIQLGTSGRRSPRERRRRRVALGVIGAGLGLAYAFVKPVVVERLRHHEEATAAPTTTEVTAWDPRVTDIVAFVESERGLTFDHPIAIDFLSEAAFVALYEAPVEVPTTEDPDVAAAMAGIERAITAWYDDVGLAVGYSPAEGEAAVSAAATLGFYSPMDDRVFVRGDQLTAPVRAVLAHELTHALQGQHFDLALGGEDDLTIRSIAEADAMRVEDAFVATLPQAEQDVVTAENTLGAAEEAELDVVPWAVVESRYAPYVIGPTLVDDAFATSGNAGVNALLADPPSEEVLISPWLRGTPQTEVVPPVIVPTGANVLLPEQRLSMFDTVVMLDAWLTWTQARGALDGWAGGRMVMYEQTPDGPVCMAATIAFDTSAAPMAEALTAWAAAAGSSLVPTVVDRQVSFEACPRAPGATAPPDPIVSPIEAIVIEHVVLGDLGPTPPPDAVAQFTCYARVLIDDPSLGPLMFEAELDADEQAIMTWVTTAAAGTCGLAAG